MHPPQGVLTKNFPYSVNVDKLACSAIVRVHGCVHAEEFNKIMTNGHWRRFDGDNTEASAYAYAREFNAPSWTIKTCAHCIRNEDL